ncbi:hypothetical protein O0I10_001306 [Lichtheimia ornata]|uniref:Riboflavin kinase n=1 Tax=Lichtheimia ornata TaxID=688661 RepID=A0AAD7Y3I2_9FUNG|nr:uncharacterized protein O0I10_001306 [Lichtheimia ornata]KAJ8663129.1 hypothetical protein O0I10_001306 [Lichtheimia ornata]
MSLAINPDRPLLVGPEVPEHPFPHSISGTVVRGYGRGSKELGIPTANLSDDAIEAMCTDFTSGIYYGWVQIGDKSSEVYPMVMSLGWNPYYQNEKRSAEVHIIHEFPDDFYGIAIRVIVLGYVRPEQNYSSLDGLIRDIRTDVEVAKKSLQRPAYAKFQQDPLFV